MNAVTWLSLVWANPWARRLALSAAVLLSICVSYLTGYSRGFSQARDTAARKAEAVELQQRLLLAYADARYRSQEIEHAKRIAEVRQEYSKAEAAAKVADSAMVRSLGDGSKRVRVQVTRCDPGPTSPGTTPSGVDGTSTAELPGPIAAAFYSLAANCDRNTRQLTALQTWAKSAVQLCNGAR